MYAGEKWILGKKTKKKKKILGKIKKKEGIGKKNKVNKRKIANFIICRVGLDMDFRFSFSVFIFMCRYFQIKYEGTKEKLMKIKKYLSSLT